MGIQSINIIWNKIVVEITYNDNWSKSYHEIYGHGMAHLEIKSQDRKRLPITETGYRSHFTPAFEIEDYGGAEKFVCDWLDHEARSKEWKDYIQESKQLSLF